MITNGNAMRHLTASSRDWYRITNKKDEPTEILIYDEIGWFGITAEDFVKDLQEIDAKEITVRINSPGGSVFGGIAIYNALRTHKADIHIIVESLAASIAAVITQAGDTRTMVQHSQMMIHDASGIAIGNADEMQEYADLLRKQSGIIADIFATRSGRPLAVFKALMSAETWMTHDETVENGLADEVLTPKTGGDPEDKTPADPTAAAKVDPDLPDKDTDDQPQSTDFTTLFHRPFADLLASEE